MSSDTPSLKILVCYHKPAELVSGGVYTPIHVGRSGMDEAVRKGLLRERDKQWMLENTLGDNTGENISEKNSHYSELTAQYWAWKNYELLDSPDYIGFVHYRRGFLLASELGQGAVRFVSNLDAQIREEINDTSRLELGKYQLYAPEARQAYRLEPGEGRYRLKTNPKVPCRVVDKIPHQKGLAEALDYVASRYPEHEKYLRSYLSGRYAYEWNMAIFHRDVFMRFAPYFFDVLAHVERVVDSSHFSTADQRFIAYLGEHLTGAFIDEMVKRRAAVKEIPTYFVRDVRRQAHLQPSHASRRCVVVCTSAGELSVMFCGVMIRSLILHTDAKRHYEVVVLAKKLTKEWKEQLKRLAAAAANVTLRIVSTEKIQVEGNPAEPAMMVPGLFSAYARVVYISPYTVTCADIAQLFDTPMEDGQCLAACKDLITISSLNKERRCAKNFRKDFGIAHPYEELISGKVLLMDIKAMQAAGVDRTIGMPAPRAGNSAGVGARLTQLCRGRVKLLPLEWNVCPAWKDALYMPAKDWEEWSKARASAKIIQFTRGDQSPLSSYWWQGARSVPFYEQIAERLSRGDIQLRQIRRRLNWLRCGLLFAWGRKKQSYIERKNRLKAQLRKMEKIMTVR